jgi:HisA/HisF family protein
VRIIGVIDLLGGRAVHARAGARDRYAPVPHAAGRSIDGNARRLADAYIGVLGISEMYVADLDAILDQRPQEEIAGELVSLGAPVWLDAGVRAVDDARRAIALGTSSVIVALETLPSFDVLADICAQIGNDRVAFSLDLRDGQPILIKGAHADGARTPEEIASLAVASGAGSVIAIDLARVGTGRGLDVDLLSRIHKAVPESTLVAGGGIRGWDDLVQVSKAGCSAALIATALHDGRITAAEISDAREL